MKRVFSAFLIALLLCVPVLSAHADSTPRVFVPDGLATEAELDSLNARAEEIHEAHGVGVYFFYDLEVEDLTEYVYDFMSEHVTDASALILGVNADHYYFMKTDAAIGAFPDDVTDGKLWEAFRSVKNDPHGKIMAYLDAADEVLNEYDPETPAAPAGSGDDLSVPDYIALTDSGKPTVVDRAGLLTSNEAEALSNRLKEIGSAYRCDVIVATVESLGSKTSEAYADDFFDYNGYGYGATPDANGTTINGDGILLLISMEDRDFAISTSGYGITAFTDYGIQTYLEDRFLPYLSRNDFNRGFLAYADACEYLLKTAREGIPYDYRRVFVDGWTDAELLSHNDRAESVAEQYDVGIYFLESPAITDANAFSDDFIENRTFEVNTVVLVHGANGYSIRTSGAIAGAKFSNETLTAIAGVVEPYLITGDTKGALNAYMDKCIAIVSDYGHVLADGAISEDARSNGNIRLKQLFEQYGVALYFLYDAEASDPNALAKSFLDGGTVYEGNAVVLGANKNGSGVAVRGDLAKEKFSDKRIAKLVKEVDANLSSGSVGGALDAFAERGESILNWKPVNWFTFTLAAIAGLLFGFIPVNSMKRQLTDVSKQTNADPYLKPNSFVLTQNSNVLLNKHLSRSVHVIREESSGGPRGGGGGSSFHGGSSTHTSSSGGSHGGHSGKF